MQTEPEVREMEGPKLLVTIASAHAITPMQMYALCEKVQSVKPTVSKPSQSWGMGHMRAASLISFLSILEWFLKTTIQTGPLPHFDFLQVDGYCGDLGFSTDVLLLHGTHTKVTTAPCFGSTADGIPLENPHRTFLDKKLILLLNIVHL